MCRSVLLFKCCPDFSLHCISKHFLHQAQIGRPQRLRTFCKRYCPHWKTQHYSNSEYLVWQWLKYYSVILSTVLPLRKWTHYFSFGRHKMFQQTDTHFKWCLGYPFQWFLSVCRIGLCCDSYMICKLERYHSFTIVIVK